MPEKKLAQYIKKNHGQEEHNTKFAEGKGTAFKSYI